MTSASRVEIAEQTRQLLLARQEVAPPVWTWHVCSYVQHATDSSVSEMGQRPAQSALP